MGRQCAGGSQIGRKKGETNTRPSSANECGDNHIVVITLPASEDNPIVVITLVSYNHHNVGKAKVVWYSRKR